MLPDIRQYICWHYVDRPNEPKPTKVPLDPVSARLINHLDPSNWMTREEATRLVQTTHADGVGFVITANDNIWCIDLDDVVENGQYDPLVSDVARYFPEAFYELSVSETGIHIWGVGQPPENHRIVWYTESNGLKKKIEFYSKKRFIALGRPLGGTFGKYDYTSCLQQFVPVHQIDTSQVQLADQADPAYTGPADDNELIQKMLNAPGSAAALFGNRATLVDLWTGNAQRLAQFFPSDRDEYDRSSADAALCFHLAFWAGKNTARIDRLFRLSGLMRDKWNRPDYMWGTVSKACGLQKRVYDIVKEAPSEAAGTDQSRFLTADEIIEHFKGCYYIKKEHRVFCPDGSVLKPEGFNVVYGGFTFKLDLANRSTTKDAFKAFTQSEIFRCPMVDGRAFRPDLTPGDILTRHGKTYINTYVPVPVDTLAGDVTPFLRHMQLLFPNERDRSIVLSYMIALVQNPGVKFQWCPVIQGMPGNGKTTLLRCLAEAIGDHYFYKPKARELGSKFNAGYMNRLLIGVEEVHINDRREIVDAIKDVITDTRIEFEAKGMDQQMGDNRANWFMLTNHKDAIPKEKNDRRFSVFFTAQQEIEDLERDGMTGDYFKKLYHWLEHEGGYKMVAHYLHTAVPVAEFNPADACERAPLTSTTGEAIIESRGAVEQEINEAVESERRGFKGGYIGSGAVKALLKETNRRVSARALGAALQALGYVSLGRASKMMMEEGDGRITIYVKKDHPITGQPSTVITDMFMAAQGYSGATGVVATNNVLQFPSPPLG